MPRRTRQRDGITAGSDDQHIGRLGVAPEDDQDQHHGQLDQAPAPPEAQPAVGG